VAAAYNYQATIRKEDPGILNFIYATQQKGEKKLPKKNRRKQKMGIERLRFESRL